MLLVLARIAIALVWLYNGLWCKLLGGCPDHARIVASAARPLHVPSTPVLLVLGAVECAIALWVLSGVQPRTVAWVQTVLLVGMNVAGIAFGGGEVSRPAGLLVHNFVLLVLVWMVATSRRPPR